MTRISSARISMEGGRVEQAVLKAYGETLVGGASGTNAGASLNIDLATGNVFNYVLNSATCAISFTNQQNPNAHSAFTLILKQDATGGRLATWPSNIVWTLPPTLTTTADRFDIFVFTSMSRGAYWVPFLGGKNYA